VKKTASPLYILLIAAMAFMLAIALNPALTYAQAKKDRVDLNKASEKELESLKGVGPATAKKIIENRPYKSVDELSKAGVSAKTIQDLKPFVTVGPAAPAAKPAKPAKEKAKPAAAEKAKVAEKAAPKPAPGQLVDLNKASQQELDALKGVGPSTAKKIIENRPYKSVDELSKAGLSAKAIQDLKPFVTVGAPAAKPAKPPKEKPAAAEKAKAPEKAAAPKLAPGQKVNINTATKEQLVALPEIGEVKAQAIIDGRPYQKPEDVMKVKGIKEGTYGAIKDYITVK
jgi:competence protein ComEA